MFIYYIIIYKSINWFAHQISLICLCVVDKLLKHFFKLLYKPTVNKDDLLTYLQKLQKIRNHIKK